MNRKLPLVAAYHHPTSEDLIFVMRGRSGFWPAEALGVVDDDLTADVWNEAHDITKAEAEAMFSGSMWGWDVPAANPENYDAAGVPLIAKRLDD